MYHWSRVNTTLHPHREAGQAAVETAVVMPMMVFIVLALIQLGLIAQARAMAKYAAYRAVRVGAMNNADPQKMEAAALFYLAPVLATPTGARSNQHLDRGAHSEVILSTTNPTDLVEKFTTLQQNNDLVPGLKQVAVVICGPIGSELDGSSSTPLPDPIRRSDQDYFYGVGSPDEVDFDDPKSSSDMLGEISDNKPMVTTLRAHLRTKLRIQVQLHYRMPIPFANWLLAKAYMGMELPAILRLGKEHDAIHDAIALKRQNKFKAESAAADLGIYTVPINVNYSFRMQSNLFLKKNALPGSNECVHYQAPN
jgi:hypothetical protein